MNKKRFLGIFLLAASILLIAPNFSLTGAVIGSNIMSYFNFIAILAFISGALVFFMAGKEDLEELVKEVGTYSTSAQILQAMQEDITNPEIYGTLQNYLIKHKKRKPEEVEEYVNANLSGAWQKNPALLGVSVREHSEEDKQKLLKRMQYLHPKIISQLDDREVQQIALGLPDKNKKYIAIQQAIAEGDTKTAREAYLETFESEDWKRTMAAKTNNELMDFAAKYTMLQTKKFVDKYLATEGKYDAAKARDYLQRTIGGLEPEVKEAVLIDLGARYAAKKSEKKKK